MTRRRSAYDASIRPSILWQHEVACERHALVRRPDRASQHLDHPPDLRLRGNEGRRHGDGFAGKAVEHPFLHPALEYLERAQARLALQRFELDRRRESDVADVRDARLALERVHGLLEHRLELARPHERALFLDRIERGKRRSRGHGMARVGVTVKELHRDLGPGHKSVEIAGFTITPPMGMTPLVTILAK